MPTRAWSQALHGDFHLVQKSLLGKNHVRFLLAALLQNLRKLLQLGFQLGALPGGNFFVTCLYS